MLEVWFWINGEIQIHVLGDIGYRLVERSQFVPDLEPELLESLLHHGSLTEAIAGLLAALAARRGPAIA